jgi:hypothetical protein
MMLIDWSGEFLDMRTNMNKLFELFNDQKHDDAIECLNQIIVNARALRAYTMAKRESNEQHR